MFLWHKGVVVAILAIPSYCTIYHTWYYIVLFAWDKGIYRFYGTGKEKYVLYKVHKLEATPNVQLCSTFYSVSHVLFDLLSFYYSKKVQQINCANVKM